MKFSSVDMTLLTRYHMRRTLSILALSLLALAAACGCVWTANWMGEEPAMGPP